MSEHSVEVEVACSTEEVYDLWKNIENVPRWIPLVKEVKILPGTEELSRWKFGLGFPLLTEWTSRITQRIPQKLIAWESVSGLPNFGCAEFFPTERGCRLRLTLAFELPKGIVGAFLEAIGIDRWLEANLVESLHRFQSLIEEEVLRQKTL
ncbi:polyketide cyclase / dehydrase [Hydrococcus rivularis NIES-593]|uniref:Polyketide cyclase / dehydrase n=1 Tax=Hydrococcus rivularis NIES-593 TaxID=1921803 RepID=A0A1U7HT52_9CYAN|nr:SRPBCC family protein [Hydrococcus rivularis]OKH26757.1 polyketide cyclase / dehydrase [Hydrococcus rivularis NIES-593]